MIHRIKLDQFIVTPQRLGRTRRYLSQETSVKRIVVSGASKGIGLEFTRQYLAENPTNQVIAISRSYSTSLEGLSKEYGNRLRWIPADITDESSVNSATEQIKQQFPFIDVLLNVAGVLGDGQEKRGPERSLQQLDLNWLRHSFDINLFGHIILTRNLLPLLKKNPKDERLSKVINISAKVGSITDNKLGGWYSYRMSKAALNMFSKTLSAEITTRYRCVIVSLHPGPTDTDLSKPFQKSMSKKYEFQPAEVNVRKMMSVISSLQLEDSGSFLDYESHVIPF
eukprot:gene16336-18519_t